MMQARTWSMMMAVLFFAMAGAAISNNGGSGVEGRCLLYIHGEGELLWLKDTMIIRSLICFDLLAN
jgi:hypothetical protein